MLPDEHFDPAGHHLLDDEAFQVEAVVSEALGDIMRRLCSFRWSREPEGDRPDLRLVHDLGAEGLDCDGPSDPGRGIGRGLRTAYAFRADGPQSITVEEALDVIGREHGARSGGRQCRHGSAARYESR